jgi:hypothetical protein
VQEGRRSQCRNDVEEDWAIARTRNGAEGYGEIQGGKQGQAEAKKRGMKTRGRRGNQVVTR